MHVGDEVPPILIDGSDPARSVEDVSPLGYTVPVTGRSESARDVYVNRRLHAQFAICVW